MSQKIPILIVLFTLITAASVNGVAFSSQEVDEGLALRALARTPRMFQAGAGGGANHAPDSSVMDRSQQLGTNVYLPLLTRQYCSGFFDNFSNPASGWQAAESENVRSEYTNGEFLIHTKKAGYVFIYRAPACEFDNYSIEVDARWLNLTGSSYGLAFEIQPGFSDFYIFEINTDYQAFRLYRYSPSGWTAIVPVTSSPAIHAGFASNHLGVIRPDDSTFTLTVNGITLGTWWDASLPGIGGVGIFSHSYTDRGISDALFDNFRMYGLPSTSSGAGSAATTGAGTSNPPVPEKYIEIMPALPDW